MYFDFEDRKSRYYDQLIQIVLIGDAELYKLSYHFKEVGKTALTSCFTQSTFSPDSYTPTILWCHVTTLKVDGIVVKLRIFDTAGKEDFKPDKFHLSTQYRESQIALLVYDVTSRESFKNVKKWNEELVKNSCGNILCKFLVGNKTDLKEKAKAVLTNEGDEMAEFLGCFQHVEISAKEKLDVHELLVNLVRNGLAAKKTRKLEIKVRDELCKSILRTYKKNQNKNPISVKRTFKNCFPCKKTNIESESTVDNDW